MKRKIEGGIVVSSDRTVYSISEADILTVAEQEGVTLTEERMDTMTRLVEKGISGQLDWARVVEMALEELEN